MALERNVERVEKLGFKQLIETALPDTTQLSNILNDATQETASSSPLCEFTSFLQSKANYLASRPHENKTAQEYYLQDIRNILHVTLKIHQLIERGVLIPAEQETTPLIVNKLSQRLFLKDQTLYSMTHRELTAEKLNFAAVPRLANSHGIFAVMLTKKNGHYFLEHRINNNAEANGHVSLVDGQINSVIFCGETDLENGEHLFSSDKTGHFHERVYDVLGLTVDDQRILMDFCLHGLARCYYGLRENLDEDRYQKIRALARALLVPEGKSQGTTSGKIYQKLHIRPSTIATSETKEKIVPNKRSRSWSREGHTHHKNLVIEVTTAQRMKR